MTFGAEHLEAKLSQRVANELIKGQKKHAGENRIIGKDDRATSEQVMDPRTRMIIFKLLSSNFLTSVDGCVSTGKEANVYHATSGSGQSLALKVFKTSILVFKDRDKYVSGEFRFRDSYGKKNPRKMVKMWALKELRNLKRLHSRRISCPEPLFLRNNVLVMEFIGEKGWPALRLKDLSSLKLSEEKVESLYRQCLKLILKMYKKANLSHGDLSEYNILYVRKVSKKKKKYFGSYNLILIDVSQSVELDHPLSDTFLKLDIKNCDLFFKKLGVKESRRVFQKNFYSLVKDKKFDLSKYSEKESNYEIEEEEILIESWLDEILENQNEGEEEEEELVVEDADPTEDIEARFVFSDNDDDNEDSSEEESEEDGENCDGEEIDIFKKKVRSSEKGTVKLKEMTREEKKEHKKKVKEEAREKRKTKTPKAIKKRNKKIAKQKRR